MIDEIRETVKDEKVIVAFSGGEDSSLAALLMKEALGKDRVELVTVHFGEFTYIRTEDIIREFSRNYGFKHTYIDGSERQRSIWKHGPSCNACTKLVKLGLIKEYAKGRIVVSGANRSDSWGKTYLKFHQGVYTPLLEFDKKDIREMLDHFGVQIKKIGEARNREGCKLKHLLKMLVKREYHGRAVSVANELLLSILDEEGFKADLANVKIIGPLSKNIALVNLKPDPPDFLKNKVKEALKKVEVIDEVFFVDTPIELDIVANPSIYRNESSREWILKGRLQPEFSQKVVVRWRESKNNRLRTFQVVGYRRWENGNKG